MPTATSQNGYPVLFTKRTTGSLPRLRNWQVPGIDRQFLVRDGSAGFLLTYCAAMWHAMVDPLPGGIWDEWAHHVRPVRGQSSGYSNHASGTAIDVDATQFPRGIRAQDRMSAAQIETVRTAILPTFEGCIRWGGDYQSTPDAMHFELNLGMDPVQRVAVKLAKTPLGAAILNANPGAWDVIIDGNPYVTTTKPIEPAPAPPVPKPPKRNAIPRLPRRKPKQHRVASVNVHKAGPLQVARLLRAARRTDCDAILGQEGKRRTLVALRLHPAWDIRAAKSNGGKTWSGNFGAVRRKDYEIRRHRSLEVKRPDGGPSLWLLVLECESKRVPGAMVVFVSNHMPHRKYEPATYQRTRANGLAVMRALKDQYAERGWAVVIGGDTNDKQAAKTYADALEMAHGAGQRIDQIHGSRVVFRAPKVIRKGVLGRITDHPMVLVTFRPLPPPAPSLPDEPEVPQADPARWSVHGST